MRHLAMFALVLVAACSGTKQKAAGEKCIASTECGPGLVCDFGAGVCANMGSLDAFVPPVDGDPLPIDARPIDARPMIDARPIDAFVIDAFVPLDAPPDTL